MNTATATTTSAALDLGTTPIWSTRSAFDWLFAAAVIVLGAYAFVNHQSAMDGYEKTILLLVLPAAIGMGWFWRPLQGLMYTVGALTGLAITLYNQHPGEFGANLVQADQVFVLKYFLSSQSAILWMSVLVLMSTCFYWLGFGAQTPDNAGVRLGSKLAWISVVLALVGTLVRWFESHQMGPGVGHIPVSNLYEVFVLFCWLTTLFYLYYEQHYGTWALGAFVMLVISAAVGFLLWYALVRRAHVIQPLLPALQSWWMKLHVPANFIGYGTFSLSAMVAFAYILKKTATDNRWITLASLFLLGIVLCIEPVVFRKNPLSALSHYWAVYMGVGALVVGSILKGRVRIAERLPTLEVLDDVMYKAIAVGFAFFTIATILGAFWAAEAWGGYWSWDPKEVWALIVWLNYAAWLHMRLMKGLRGTLAAWWALAGLAVTSFAFLGVNIFLSGLHSYGTL
jgi:cytochrome c-type biogenesis protein CcsB